jgi:hypothetical protein
MLACDWECMGIYVFISRNKKIKTMALKEKHQIENYEEKSKLLCENGWETWYHDDNWIKTEWIVQGKKYDMMGRSTDNIYSKLIEK